MASHGEQVNRVKGEAGTDDMDENYVVVEVIQDGAMEQYEDEGSDLELEEDEMGEELQEIVEESDNYTLTEREINDAFNSNHCFNLFSSLQTSTQMLSCHWKVHHKRLELSRLASQMTTMTMTNTNLSFFFRIDYKFDYSQKLSDNS